MNNKARFLWIGLAFLLAASSLPVQADEFRLWDPLNGIPVRQGYHIEWFRTSATDGNGNMAAIWSDTRLGGRDLYMQVIDSDGNFVWSDYPDGRQVATGNNRQEDPHVMATTDGGWIISWVDYRDSGPNEDVGDIYCAKLDADGNQLWDSHPDWDFGIPVAVVDGKQKFVQGFDDGNGGAVFIWVDGRNENADLYGQHVDANGDIQWFPVGQPDEPNGIVLAGGNSNQGSVESSGYTADTDGAGGMIYGWTDNLDPTNINIYANRVDSGGELVWADSSGIALSLAPAAQERLKMAPDGEGGAYFVWEDRLDPSDFDLYGQHIDAQGNISWADGGAVICDAVGTQEAPRIVNSAVGEAIVVWEDKRFDDFEYDLFTQRVSNDFGSPMLHWGDGSNGLVLTDEENDQREARLFPDGSGGAVFTWVDERIREAPNNDLFGQRIDENGDWQWGPDYNGKAISDADFAQGGNIVRLITPTRIGIVWLDNREGSPGLFVQLYDLDGNEILVDNGVEIVYGIDGSALHPGIFSIGDTGNYYVTWTDGRLGDFGNYPYVQILNALPQDANYDFQFEVNGKSLLPGYPISGPDTTTIEAGGLTYTTNDQGDLFAVWQDSHINFITLLFAQKMDAQGNVLWGDRGTPVALNEDDPFPDAQQSPRMLPTDDGGMIVVYNQNNNAFWLQVYAQRLDADGEPLWGDGTGEGIELTTLDENHAIQAIEYFDNGDILIVYQHNDAGNDKDLFAHCIDQNGNLVWADEITLCEADELQSSARTVHVDGGIVVVWEDQRRGGSIKDLYGQKIAPDGSLGWAADGQLLVEDDGQQNEVSLKSFGDDATWFWMTWKSAADGLHEDILCQRYDLDGAPLLTPASGITIGLDDHIQQTPQSAMDSQGGLYILWEDEPVGQIFSDLMYTRLDMDGELVAGYAPEGNVMTNAYQRQAVPSILPDLNDGIVAVWRDARSTGKDELQNIYVQRSNELLTGVGEFEQAQLPVKMKLGNNYPNPFNPSTHINFSIDRPANVRLVIYDVLGREVVQLVNQKLTAGSHEVMWNGLSEYGHQVASGTYFYRLEVNGELMTRSMVLLK